MKITADSDASVELWGREPDLENLRNKLLVKKQGNKGKNLM